MLRSFLSSSENISNTEFPRFAMEDFNTSQSIYQEELKLLERFVSLSSRMTNELDSV